MVKCRHTFNACVDPSLCKKLKPKVEKLAKVLRVLRAQRLAKGALELESTEVKFKVTENHTVTDINILFCLPSLGNQISCPDAEYLILNE